MQVDDKEVIYFLLKTEIVPYCLRCMDVGKGLSKTVSTRTWDCQPSFKRCFLNKLSTFAHFITRRFTHNLKITQVATFIVQKILMNEEGLRYCCIIADRFFAITRALETMMEKLVEEPSRRLLKHIIRCYLKLSESPRLAQNPLKGFTNVIIWLILPLPFLLQTINFVLGIIDKGHVFDLGDSFLGC